MSKSLRSSILEINICFCQVTYPLREYISSKKDDDYHRSYSSSAKSKNDLGVNIFIDFI
jgi:hypothetical protein